jgi:hypothetical protein
MAPDTPTPWRPRVARAAAIGLGVASIGAGSWKLIDPPNDTLLAIAAISSGVLLLLPATRRWGAWFTVVLLIAFTATHQNLSTALLLVPAIAAAIWSPRPRSAEGSIIIFLIFLVAALTWAGILRFRQSAPPGTITVETAPSPRGFGRVIIYAARMFTAWCKRLF